MPSIAENLAFYLGEVSKQSSKAKLIAVSKKHSIELIREAFEAGQVHFGENYVQEFSEKFERLEGLNLTWHFIGHLQSNKIQHLVGKMSWLHTLDRFKLALKLQELWPEDKPPLKALIQVKISNDDTKYGCPESDVFDLIHQCLPLSRIQIKGLMGMSSRNASQDQITEEFRRLKALFDSWNHQHADILKLEDLSLGMTNDYKLALQEGSTMIRIGSGIFGQRES